jgi:phenylalanyl-tRNA synthetase beta chain
LQPITPLTVRLRSARCNSVLGLRLTTEVIGKSLERLGLSVIMVEEGVLDVTIPTFRRDISREIDLIEEVARVYGYEQIPTTLPKTVNPMAGRSLSKRLEERAKSALLRCGLTEVITFSMENIADVERSGIATAQS